ncbi:MAG: hypothetical protein V3U71_03265 [Cocleimonas sp.]
MKKYPQASISRRKFISGGVILGAGVVAAVAIPNAAVASVKQPTDVENKKEEGYRLTKHIADYYKSAAL